MASDLFSLSWDDFHKNMSVGMNSLLENEDLVDVTIAVEGRYLKAHKMVLSVCSPYFRELFRVTPCKHPIVFLKDVSYIAMRDLLQFMYQGEVQVSQENLTTFIKTGEALQIKGLTDHGNQVPSECDNEPNKENKRVTESAETTSTSVIKTEPATVTASTSSVERLIQFKEEPCDLDENFKDDPLDNTNEDYSMMEDIDEEPMAGTSGDGMAGGQGLPKMSDIENNEIGAAALATVNNLLPEKSLDRYNKTYCDFKEWCNGKNITKFSEDEVLLYFEEKAKIRKSSSLWAIYSMLKTTIKLRDNIDLSNYRKLLSFLKRQNVGYKPKKSSVFNVNQVNTFLQEARDKEFIHIKVALIMGLAGACRSNELCRMSIHDLNIKDDIITVNVPHSDNGTSRQFAIIQPMEFNEDIPLGLLEDASAANNSLIPEKSKLVYEKTYLSFRDWCSENEVKNIGEDVVLAFLEQKSKSVKPVSLWPTYSMLKTMLSVKDGIDLKRYPKVIPFLKRKCEGYIPRKSAILTGEEIDRFINEADNQTHLLLKTILIMGVAGACRCEELVKLTINNIEDMGNILIVKILDTKTHSERTFTITNVKYIEIYRKYRALRPSYTTSDRLFLKYANGRCFNQVVGINRIGVIPSLIARFLGKKDFKVFTGHCFRKSATALLAIDGSTRRRRLEIF